MYHEQTYFNIVIIEPNQFMSSKSLPLSEQKLNKKHGKQDTVQLCL